jgi:hypothetical protein
MPSRSRTRYFGAVSPGCRLEQPVRTATNPSEAIFMGDDYRTRRRTSSMTTRTAK